MNIWDILGIVATIILLASLDLGKNAIWATLALGVIVGLIICLSVGFSWLLYKKFLILSVLIGGTLEKRRTTH